MPPIEHRAVVSPNHGIGESVILNGLTHRHASSSGGMSPHRAESGCRSIILSITDSSLAYYGSAILRQEVPERSSDFQCLYFRYSSQG